MNTHICNVIPMCSRYCGSVGDELWDAFVWRGQGFVPMRRLLDGPGRALHAILNSPLFSMQVTLSCCSLFSSLCFSKVDFLWSVTGKRFRPVTSLLLDIHSTIIPSAQTGLLALAAHFWWMPPLFFFFYTDDYFKVKSHSPVSVY